MDAIGDHRWTTSMRCFLLRTLFLAMNVQQRWKAWVSTHMLDFLHRDRPGRQSLSLDLMEELRGIMADRFALTLINKKIIKGEHFDRQGDGAVLLSDEGRKQFFLQHGSSVKRETITHPFLNEKIPGGWCHMYRRCF